MNNPLERCGEFASSIGIPKIAAWAELVSVLRKSEPKMLKKFAGSGRIKSFSRYVIPENSSRGSRNKDMDSRLQSTGMTTRGEVLYQACL
jgi:hypothetical protein